MYDNVVVDDGDDDDVAGNDVEDNDVEEEGRSQDLGKVPEPRTQDHTLCEPAQSKCTSTFHKSHLIRKFTGKVPEPQNLGAHFVRACAVETHVKISQEPLYAEIYRKNAGAQSEHPDQAPAFALTVRTPQCGHAVWGEKKVKQFGDGARVRKGELL